MPKVDFVLADGFQRILIQASVSSALQAASNYGAHIAMCQGFGSQPYTAEKVEAEMGPEARAAWEAVQESCATFMRVAEAGKRERMGGKPCDTQGA